MEISSEGRIRDSNKKEIKKLSRGNQPYFYVWCKPYRAITVHRLVAQTFIGPQLPGRVVDHIDRNKLNNSLSNLRYVTQQENTQNRNHEETERLQRRLKEQAQERRQQDAHDRLVRLEKLALLRQQQKTYKALPPTLPPISQQPKSTPLPKPERNTICFRKKGKKMAGEVKRLLASVPSTVGHKIKVALAIRGESMQKVIVRSLVDYLDIELTLEERESLDLITKIEQDDLNLSEIANG